MAGLAIQDMQLSINARKAAQLVLAAHPDAVFTSGRRDAKGQARAMAENVVRFGPIWLKQTYKDPALVALLTNYTEQHPDEAKDGRLLGHGYYGLLVGAYAGQLGRFPHLRGDAFDLAWPKRPDGSIDRERGQAIITTIETLPAELELRMVLKREGALDVIHAEFNHLTIAEV